jgi:hypothetical protein
MMASRGMGDIAPSKMPKGRTIKRKDDPNKVEMYKRGGLTAKYMKFSDKGKPMGMAPVTKAKSGGKMASCGCK